MDRSIVGTQHVLLCCCGMHVCRMLGAESFMGQTKLSKPGSHAYDEKIAKELWEESAARAGVPVAAQA